MRRFALRVPAGRTGAGGGRNEAGAPFEFPSGRTGAGGDAGYVTFSPWMNWRTASLNSAGFSQWAQKPVLGEEFELGAGDEGGEAFARVGAGALAAVVPDDEDGEVYLGDLLLGGEVLGALAGGVVVVDADHAVVRGGGAGSGRGARRPVRRLPARGGRGA